MPPKYDFGGYATRNNMLCSDGLIIRENAFKHNDGAIVPLVWNHQHRGPDNILGHALLENRKDGVYAYCSFNETEMAQDAKEAVKHGDINSLSIYANHLKKTNDRRNVIHGDIKEVSLVVAGANPGASIDNILIHGEVCDEDGVIYTGEYIQHGKDLIETDNFSNEPELKHSDNKEESEMEGDEKTIQDVYDSMTEEQQNVVAYMVAQALEDDEVEPNEENDPKEDDEMSHNIFENESRDTTLTHADTQAIVGLAKQSSIGSLREAIAIYCEQNESLAHSIDNIEALFPEYKDVYPGAPEFIQRDQTWVDYVIGKVHKSPISRIRTRQADIRDSELRAKGYQKGKKKTNGPNIKLIKRTTDPQTVYRKDYLNRDDIIDITDFDVVEYQYKVMRGNLYEDLAIAMMIGDGRDDGDPDKISEDHIRSIWNDDELYTIHIDVDIEAARTELQGTNTNSNFGENYIRAEAIVTAALYAREAYKGSGSLDFYCTPRMLNTMLLARDLNGRRIYNSKADLAAALDVNEIHTVEQFAGKVRTTKTGEKKKLLGIFVNLSDYQLGSTKGGEITKFNQFDIDFNQEKYLIETRVSGSLTRVYSAIVLEEPDRATTNAADED